MADDPSWSQFEAYVLRGLKSGDRATINRVLELVYVSYLPKAVALLRTYNYSDHDIEDAIQITVLKLYDRFSEIGDNALFSWFMTVLKNQAVDHARRELRRRKLMERIAQQFVDRTPTQEQSDLKDQVSILLSILERFVDELTESERRVYDLLKSGVSQKEIGKLLGKTYSHVRTIKSRMTERLRELVLNYDTGRVY